MLTNIAKTITRILLAFGATLLAMMMFLTAMDVGLRYIFNRPLTGAFEIAFLKLRYFYRADGRLRQSIDGIWMGTS